MGRGGVSLVARATGISRQTLHNALKELAAPPVLDGRIRRPGAGRKRLRDRDPELEAALDALIDPDVRGDPESPLRWTCKSTGQLALALTRGGHPVSASTVGTMLHEAGYSLQANAKTKEGGQHPDRDPQFRYLNEQVRQFREAGLRSTRRRHSDPLALTQLILAHRIMSAQKSFLVRVDEHAHEHIAGDHRHM